METALKNTSVLFGDREFFIFYFIDDNAVNPNSGFLNLTVGSDDDEFERITSSVPKNMLDNEKAQVQMVQKMVLKYLNEVVNNKHKEV